VYKRQFYGYLSTNREAVIISSEFIGHRPPIGFLRKVKWTDIENIYYSEQSKYRVIKKRKHIFFPITIDLSYPNFDDILNDLENLLPAEIEKKAIYIAKAKKQKLKQGNIE
jgi:hypothetical protein